MQSVAPLQIKKFNLFRVELCLNSIINWLNDSLQIIFDLKLTSKFFYLWLIPLSLLYLYAFKITVK
jgi:hypothetical protein